jgi:hypothetical protein
MASAGRRLRASLWPPPRRQRRDIDHLRALMQQTPATLTGNGIGIVLIGGIFGNLAPRPSLRAGLAGRAAVLLWLTCGCCTTCATAATPTPTTPRWRAGAQLAALVIAQGALWGLAAWLFWGLGTPYHALG